MLERLADQVASITPTSTNGFQNVNSTMYMQSWWRSVGLQVMAVRRDRIMNVVKVNKLAESVPLGILLLGEIRSPERLAPAITPVTPENRTPKTVKKSTFAS